MSRKIAPSTCVNWIYGPQVSNLDGKYGLGGDLWLTTYHTCMRAEEKLYGKFTPKFVYTMVTTPADSKEMFDEIFQSLIESENILNVLLIFSAFINALGILLSPLTTFNATDAKKLLYEYYEKIYEETEHMVENMDIFVSPEDFKKLHDHRSARPKNIRKAYRGETQLIEGIVLKKNSTTTAHPLNKKLLKCKAKSKIDCTNMFATVKNPLFKPLADVIQCNCSYFKQKLEKLSTPDVTFGKPKLIHSFSNGDIKEIKTVFQNPNPEKKPPIVIKKYVDGTACDKKTYLSQLFEKTCSVLYKPYYSVPQSDTEEDMIRAALNNDEIAKFGCGSYLDNLHVFSTPIINNGVQANQSNIPVFFLESIAGQQEKIYLDFYNGPSFQFYTDVLKELLDHKVFIPTDTFFNNQRYELNTKFDVEKLECYKRMPNALKNRSGFKDKITKAFFLFVGNLIHFAVANNLELPFKLSRLYIMKLFNIFDFMEKDNPIEKKLLLISLYLLEKAPSSYTQQILQILQDPEKLKDPMIVSFLDLDQDDYDEGIRMNGYTTLVKDDFPLYNTDTYVMFYNIVDYLYKTALKNYYGDINNESIVDDTFVMNPYLQSLFDGFYYYRSYNTIVKIHMNMPNFTAFNFEEKLSIVRKTDIYLSGFGISYESITATLIENIKIKHLNPTGEYLIVSPLKHFNPDAKYRDAYIKTNDRLENEDSDLLKTKLAEVQRQIGPNYAFQIKLCFYLYRILVNRGRDISKEFIAQYNQKFFDIPYDIATTRRHESMSNEDYHNEFVKLLLKAWTGSPTIGAKEYKLVFITAANRLPATHTCFNNMDINKLYASVTDLYKDLVVLVTEGSNFGEALTGGGLSSRKNKKRSK